MTDHQMETPGENGDPVPRDMQDQQADAVGEDPWDITPTRSGADGSDEEEERDGEEKEEDGQSATDVPYVPDTDEAGTGRRGAPHSGTVHPEHPAPDESTA
ncbi:hypothetical protein [Streptomyces sp. NPDC002845]